MPREVFVAGQILTAAEMNVVSDQTVMVFDDSAARGSAIPTPSEGMVTYLKDSDQLFKYTDAWVPAGGVLQVISTNKTDTFSASVASGEASGNITNLTVTITPSSASSKLLIFGSLVLSADDSSAIYAQLFRDGAVMDYRGDAASLRVRRSVGFRNSSSTPTITVPLQFSDDAGSVSETVYSVRLGHIAAATKTLYLNRTVEDTDSTQFARFASSLTVMEVGV